MRFYTIEVIAESEDAAMEAVESQNSDGWAVSHADLVDPAFNLYAVTIERVF